MTSKSRGLAWQTVAYAVALCVAAFVVTLVSQWHPLWRVAAADVAATLTIFIFSCTFKNSSFYDPYWSVKPAVIGLYFLHLFGWHDRSLLVSGLLLLYGLRLTSNFLRDWPGLHHQDWRYDDLQARFPRSYWLISFAGIHFFPTVLVYLACIPAFYGSFPVAIGPLALVGGGLFLFSIALSFIADEQMRRFRQQGNHGQPMDTGLWRVCRHPNYLGEILGWWGLYLIALGTSRDLWWTGAGALAITCLFVFISIPMMERRNREKRADFADYAKRVPSLLPRPWRYRGK